MIAGQVNAAFEPTLQLVILNVNGQQQPLEVVLDTGFTGFLALAAARIASLGWPWLRRSQGILADGSSWAVHVYQATILWEGQIRRVDVHALDGDPQIGMRLLYGHEIKIEVVTGGPVIVQPLSTP